jgi:hypothetical protein
VVDGLGGLVEPAGASVPGVVGRPVTGGVVVAAVPLVRGGTVVAVVSDVRRVDDVDDVRVLTDVDVVAAVDPVVTPVVLDLMGAPVDGGPDEFLAAAERVTAGEAGSAAPARR